MKPGNLPQIRIIHFSDIHFGPKHNCMPPDLTGSAEGVPLLEDLIIEDLKDPVWAYSIWATSKQDNLATPLFLAVTGDLTERASSIQFNRAHDFISRLSNQSLIDTTPSLDNLFIVPGNHDVDFTKQSSEERFQSYCTFYNKLLSDNRKIIQPHLTQSLSQVHVRPADRLVVIEINSCQYVEKETYDESRGQIDLASIKKLRDELKNLEKETNGFIKVALIHHHPILIPTLIDPNRGYDAVLNGGSLLKLLREQGVHLILHGHKHYPQVFSYDPESAWSNISGIPQLIIGGGSCGSSDLPLSTASCNTYNVITIKWDPEANYARVQVITRGLITVGGAGLLDPDQWSWKTLRIFDKTLGPFKTIPGPSFGERLPNPERSDEHEKLRSDYYTHLRFNLPVVEILPSLLPDQAYEARVWLEPFKRWHEEYPVRVIWSAGPKFEKKLCHQSESTDFCAYFHYWGPMVVQAELEFDDGKKSYCHIYARFPESKER